MSEIEFPAFRSYGVPNPAGVVRRIVEGPLNPELVALFDELLTTGFKVGRIECSETWKVLPDGACEAVNDAVRSTGLALLGDAGLLDDVCCVLGDGPAEGDVMWALAELYEGGDIELGPAMRAQIERVYTLPPSD